MVEIEVYKTAKEAKKLLEKYEQDNREAFEGFVKHQGESASERLGKQTYYFVAELGAYVDDNPEKFYFESVAFPFLGWNSLHDDIKSLVQGVKDAVRHQTPKNIEAILYTVDDHDAKNNEMKGAVENLSPEGAYGFDKEELEKSLEVFEKLEKDEERGLTEQERQEFVRLYERG
ncbi:MAG: hypothetical protein KKA62_04350 [Nanoarchaeota archaeon]|nr:hypothetical protein [Nanoarchaeota archaeon]MBU1643637.1 hypothetical protein [Nanoarchaeota archaeon]MBU1977151.1 hypothetical protein [Nanoarchaeota archaeon]